MNFPFSIFGLQFTTTESKTADRRWQDYFTIVMGFVFRSEKLVYDVKHFGQVVVNVWVINVGSYLVIRNDPRFLQSWKKQDELK